ncbi:hypothetical protein WD019_02340 [Fictibacillus sp. Mic-4]|uniref:hypothetical protein n=1 Tax=Fictibacillus sp. Mic-4 TaxID=3132826 RepID=UPI003CEF5320
MRIITNITNKSAAQKLRQQTAEVAGYTTAQKIADDFIDFLNEFHSHSQPYDDLMDAEFYEQYARILREQSEWGYFNWKTAPDGTPRPTFAPSGAAKSDRELYEKIKRSKPDNNPPSINQRNWSALGSQVGGYIQREIMLSERHFKKLTGKEPRFKFERTERNEPAFEHFKKVIHEVDFNGEKFGLNGLPDGILHYVTDDGEILRVGLEVKSFQKGWSAFKSLNQPKEDHVLQTTVYSEMYGLDYYIILYHLTYGVDWKREDIVRNKAFGRYITQDDRNEILAKFARVTKAARENTPPPLDLSTWTYNAYKHSIALSITDEEFALVEGQAKQALKSRLPEWKKRIYTDAYDYIKSVREGVGE